MVDKIQLAKILGRRQKRLLDWRREVLETANLNSKFAERFREKLETYGLLLAKVASARSETDLTDSLSRIDAAERELNRMAEDYRLETANLS